MIEDLAPFPHCDSRVLHHPFEQCRYCNMYPQQQLERFERKVAFTGRWRQGLEMCPAEQERGLESINRWHGNIAFTPAIEAAEDAYWAKFRESWEQGTGRETGGSLNATANSDEPYSP